MAALASREGLQTERGKRNWRGRKKTLLLPKGDGVNYSHTLGVNLGVTPEEHPRIWAEPTFSFVESTALQRVAPHERPKAELILEAGGSALSVLSSHWSLPISRGAETCSGSRREREKTKEE